MSRTFKIILGVMGGILLVCLAALLIYCYAGWRTRRMYDRVDDVEERSLGLPQQQDQEKARQEQSWFRRQYDKLFPPSGPGSPVAFDSRDQEDDRILPLDEMNSEDNTSKDAAPLDTSDDDGDQLVEGGGGAAPLPYMDKPLLPPEDDAEKARNERRRMVNVPLVTTATPPPLPPRTAKSKGKDKDRD